MQADDLEYSQVVFVFHIGYSRAAGERPTRAAGEANVLHLAFASHPQAHRADSYAPLRGRTTCRSSRPRVLRA
jgi:hypothetical protein